MFTIRLYAKFRAKRLWHWHIGHIPSLVLFEGAATIPRLY